MLFNASFKVSIHAPTRGATALWGRGGVLVESFNPRAHAGRDMIRRVRAYIKSRFQSTRPRGARLADMGAKLAGVGFQSTRPRGARHYLDKLLETQQCFNPRAHAGRDAIFTSTKSQPLTFQSTRPRGARPEQTQTHILWLLFQSTRPRGARRGFLFNRKIFFKVSIHAPTRGAT